MKLGELLEALEAYEAIFRAAKAKAAADDLARVSALLEGDFDDDVKQSLDELERQILPPEPKAAVGNINELPVKRYVRRLKEQSSDSAKFVRILSDIRSDKQMRKAEILAMTREFLDVDWSYRTAKEALEAIDTAVRYRRVRDSASKEAETSTPF